jgi:hypothetical protein
MRRQDVAAGDAARPRPRLVGRIAHRGDLRQRAEVGLAQHEADVGCAIRLPSASMT